MKIVTVDVVYALPHQLFRYTCHVPEGTALLDVVKQSGIFMDCPDLCLKHTPMGIFGKKILNPSEHKVQEGDRIELYRPITADPKALRRQRAAKNAK